MPIDKPANVHQLLPKPRDLEQRIRSLVKADSSNVLIKSAHSKERQEERGITDRMIFEVLEFGDIDRGKGLWFGKRQGEIGCKIVKKMNKNREVGVVTILIKNQKILVKTVMWEDL